MSIKHRFFRLFSIIAMLAMTFSNIQPVTAQSAGGDGIRRQVNAQSGKLSFIGPESGRALSARQALGNSVRPQDPAMALAKRFAPEFGVKNPDRDLVEMKNRHGADGRVTVRYQQKYQGIPVIAGELLVNTNDNGDLYSMSGEISSDLSLSTQPKIDAKQAKETALQLMAKWYQKSAKDFVATEPELWIYDEGLLQESTRPSELVWRMEVSVEDKALPVRELVLINAERGGISLHFNQIDTAWTVSKQVNTSQTFTPESPQPTNATSSIAMPVSSLFSPLVNTYTANQTSTLPGTFLCNQTDPTCAAGDAHAKAAHTYALGTYNLYATQFGRDSINNGGMTIISTVHYCDPDFPCPYDNANWDGDQMIYGDAHGYPLADDVVAHELTHGVTQYESNLMYYYQSGAINESFSDVFGEYYDQTNGLGNDAANVKWLIGEDVSGLGALRSMSNPPAYKDPDKMTSTYYNKKPYYDPKWDNGGVHHNSGVNNKAAYLMANGGTFNGKTVTALGWDKVAALYYEVNTNLLTSGADYSDLYYALQQACTNLTGQKGITSANCVEVKDAVDAVQMNAQPAANYNPDAPVCTSGNVPNVFFGDDIETGTSKWIFDNGIYPRWQVDSSYFGPYAQSGLHSLYADDYPQDGSTTTDARTTLQSFVVPPNAYLRFAQAYEFEFDSTHNWDGGVLEYSTNGGSTWGDAGSLIDSNGYRGTIFAGYINPLAGRSAFVGSSHGYISTRLNLSSLAGQTVSFRWRMGLDDVGVASGWWVDNVQAYTCVSPQTISGNAGSANVILSYVDANPKTVLADASGNYTITVPYGWSGTVTPSKTGLLFEPVNRTYTNVQSNQTAQDYAAYTFVDVLPSHPFWRYIEAFYRAGITSGCSQSPKMYCPDNLVTRAEMAVFIERAKGNFNPQPNPTGMFADMPYLTFTPFIEQFYNDGITTGCSSNPLMYCPANNVMRAEMATFIERAIGHFNPQPNPSGMFSDVPAVGLEGLTKFIEQFYNDGITTGCASNPLRFCPTNNVTRAEMAVFIVRAFNIPLP